MFFLDSILVPPVKFRPPAKGGDSVSILNTMSNFLIFVFMPFSCQSGTKNHVVQDVFFKLVYNSPLSKNVYNSPILLA